ncbi:MAG TPA: L,D-transpeptidase family protein [Streptosporangiaceae bacterium]|nr:L,D-transpeptidase family protein [Streptosporangiaceae bacterium]
MSFLTNLRGRVVAIGGVIVFVLVAGVWISLTHTSARSSEVAGKSKPTSTASPSKSVVAAPLQLVSETPASGAQGVNGAVSIKIQFSAPLAPTSPLPTISPGLAGTWQGNGTSTLQFVPSAAFRQYTHVTVAVPGGPTGVKSAQGGVLGSSVKIRFHVGSYQSARLVQLLAQLGYLPLTWTATPGATTPAATDATGQLAAAYSPPSGSFAWQSGYPTELQHFWQNGALSGLIMKGAVMAFESDHGLGVDGVAGSQVWAAALRAIAARQNNTHGYTYAIAREGNPETLKIWHNGQIVLHTLVNTGIQAAPTTIGTAPVYLRYYFQIMKGKNPDGTKYADPVYYVSYFRSGEAVHFFSRGSYGSPQSLGCVELPFSDAKRAYPYLTYGSLVTVSPGSLTPAGSPVAN